MNKIFCDRCPLNLIFGSLFNNLAITKILAFLQTFDRNKRTMMNRKNLNDPPEKYRNNRHPFGRLRPRLRVFFSLVVLPTRRQVTKKKQEGSSNIFDKCGRILRRKLKKKVQGRRTTFVYIRKTNRQLGGQKNV